MSEEEKKVSDNIKVIDNTMTQPNTANEPLQFVEKKEEKNLNEIKEEVVKEVDVNSQTKDEMTSEEIHNKILGGMKLPSKYISQINFETKLERRIFCPNIPECEFKKYLQLREINGQNHVAGMTDLTPLYMKSIDDLGLGVNMCLSNAKNLVSKMFFKPGVTNLVLVKMEKIEDQEIDMTDTMAELTPNIPGYIYSTSDLKALSSDWTVFSNLPLNLIAFNPQNYTDIHGGPSCNGGGFVYKINDTQLLQSELSYETTFTNMYKNLNYDPQIPNQLLDPMRRANLRTANMQMRDVIFYLYNEAPKDPLVYSPILEQLKIALYTDTFLTGFDMVEGLSQLSRVNRDKFVYDSTGPYYIAENNTNNHPSGQAINIVGCSWQQYLEYTNGRQPVQDQAYDFVLPWVPIPVKRDWFKDPVALISYIISVAPYPINCYYIPLSWAADVHVSDNDNNVYLSIFNGFAEHLSSRVRIAGYSNILLVLIDSVNTDEMNPVNPGYDNIWAINVYGLQYRFLNLFNAANPGGIVNFHNHLHQSLTAMAARIDDSPDLMMDAWSRIIKWNFYADIFNLAAYFTTRNGIHYRGSASVNNLFNTESLCSLVPAVEQTIAGNHLTIGNPSFIQRLYMVLGMVRQKGSDFISLLGTKDFKELMFSKRYSFAMLKSYLLEDKRNQVRVQFPASNSIYDGELENRRIRFGILYHNNLEYLPELSEKFGTYNSTGFLTYLRPRMQLGTNMRNLTGNSVDINEYGGLNDWARFMSTTISSTEFRVPVIDKTNLKDFSIEATERDYSFFPRSNESKMIDNLNKAWNNMYGRTLITSSGNFNHNITCWYNNSQDRVGTVQWELYIPVWTTGFSTWNADRDMNIPRNRRRYYSSTPVLVGSSYFSPPHIRVLDYNIPYLKMFDRKYIHIIMSSQLFNQPISYINIYPRDDDAIYREDKLNRQGYESLNA